MGQTGSEGEMSFFEHLEELRGHIVRSLMAVLLCAVAAFIWRKFLFDSVLLAPQQPEFITNRLFCRLGGLVHADALCINSVPVDIQNIALAGQFSAALMVSFFFRHRHRVPLYYL